MELFPKDITIAVTVYSRREFVLGAVRSALQQTLPVKVIVVEDCGPDAGMQELIKDEFGARIQYFRNGRRRGLFDNWNACMEYCTTPWLSILHDDDLLHSNFVEVMVGLAQAAAGRALYFGQGRVFNQDETLEPTTAEAWPERWREIGVTDLAEGCSLLFPGQLFDVGSARSVGGFRRSSYLTGDWDMWFKLALRFGGAQSASEVALVRSHYGPDRGTSRVNRMGWSYCLDNVQRKRNLRLLRQAKGIEIAFERTKFLKNQPVPSRLMLRYAAGFSERLLAYNASLFVQSTPPNAAYASLQRMVWLFGPQALRRLSQVWNVWQRLSTRSARR